MANNAPAKVTAAPPFDTQADTGNARHPSGPTAVPDQNSSRKPAVNRAIYLVLGARASERATRFTLEAATAQIKATVIQAASTQVCTVKFSIVMSYTTRRIRHNTKPRTMAASSKKRRGCKGGPVSEQETQ